MNANARLTDPLHRDPDHTIDRALSALRDAAPRPGLEGRILASLEHRATTLGGLPFHKVKGWGIARGNARENGRRAAHLALWTAASAAVLAIASLAILHHRTAPTQLARAPQSSTELAAGTGLAAGFSPLNMRAANNGALAPARHATNTKPFPTTNLARITHTVSSRPEHRSEAAVHSGETCISDHLACPTHEDGGVTTTPTPTDAQALADLHAPSHPAPPLPLTPQEQLFLRVLRYGNATELAELDPVVRAHHDDDETAEFKAFFPDPPPLHQPGDPE